MHPCVRESTCQAFVVQENQIKGGFANESLAARMSACGIGLSPRGDPAKTQIDSHVRDHRGLTFEMKMTICEENASIQTGAVFTWVFLLRTAKTVPRETNNQETMTVSLSPNAEPV